MLSKHCHMTLAARPSLVVSSLCFYMLLFSGIGAPRNTDRLGDQLPSARVVSNNVFRVDGKSPRNDQLTVMVMQWGQFIDHDFVATPLMSGK